MRACFTFRLFINDECVPEKTFNKQMQHASESSCVFVMPVYTCFHLFIHAVGVPYSIVLNHFVYSSLNCCGFIVVLFLYCSQ